MGEKVTYRSDGGSSEAYLAVPASGGPAPAVVVIQEWWSLVPHIMSVADRFAAAGFVALAPDLARGASASDPAAARHLVAGPALDEAAREIAAAADYLAARPDAAGRAGVVGFSAGASLALWSGVLSDRVAATVAFYPVLPWPTESPQWTNYTGKSALVHCCDDETDGVEAVRRAIADAGGVVTVHEDYPGTRHSFFNDDRPEVYDTAAAARSWARTIEHLRHTLSV